MAVTGASVEDSRAAGVTTVVGRGRAPAAVVAELMDVLAAEPRVVACDLAGVAWDGTAGPEAFRAVSDYLTSWPGPVLMMHVPDPALRSLLRRIGPPAPVMMHSSWDEAGEQQKVLPPLQRRRVQLPAQWASARSARRFTAEAVTEWRRGSVADAASQVVDALVSHTVKHAVGAVELTVSRVDGRIRVGVRDEGPRAAMMRGDASAFPLHGRRLQLVQAFADCWGVIPARAGGTTLWAVVDAEAPAAAASTQRRAHRTTRGGPRVAAVASGRTSAPAQPGLR